ncbi:MAG: hypothetical protein FWH15_05515 [Betaproteobacteria bacterium]|nr:hypothetical protein [Betaproteobacteria bacterium]
MRLTLVNASDVIRDGLGAELVDESNQTIAEVFRSDKTLTIIVNTFGNDIPLDAMEELLSYARKYLKTFEDGQPLSSATNFGTLRN